MKHITECHKVWSVNFLTVQHRSHRRITKAKTTTNLKQLEQAKVEIKLQTERFLLEAAEN